MKTDSNGRAGGPCVALARNLRVARSLLITLATLLAATGAALGQGEADETFFSLDEFVGEDGQTGDDIYRQVVANRFDAFEQIGRMRSGSRNRRFQDVRIRLRYMNVEKDGSPIVSKTIAKYFEPSDVRDLGYLIINKRKGPDDQFVYRPSARKVRRVNVRGEAVAGTDFSFEDIVPPEFEDGVHSRLPDQLIQGTPAYVVAVVPHADTESEYSKLVIAVEKEHFVPVQTHYWDNKRVLIKRLDVDPSSISSHQATEKGEAKDGWVALSSKMTQLKLDTFTELEIEEFKANPNLKSRHFSERELTASR
ncbi:outer membrane lipoprotein-sorting protein [Myxococcota bacterium]|nr:outer membrane lipoprotein-sorting protein [Myxococcota bacterium]